MMLITLSVFAFCFVLERVFTGWKLPQIPTWFSRVLTVNFIQLLIVLAAGVTWEKWLASISLLKLSHFMNPWIAGFLAYFIATFVFYWWHRWRHESDFLWKHFHQIHHSPQRLEVITSFYKHPLEMSANSLLGSLLVYTVLGLNLEAGAIYTLFTALGEFFYHTNVRTPQWVGYVFQRPEMHRIHHQKDYHQNNYGDFAIWDILFGTFENPKSWSDECGFETKKELRLFDMLKFKDVHKAVLILLLTALPFASLQSKAEIESWDEACSKVVDVVKPGDLIFLDIPTPLFRQVASSTMTWTSHVGIVFQNEVGSWYVYESTIPKAKKTPLCDYISGSSEFRFAIKRYNDGLSADDIATMQSKAESLFGKKYGFAFDFDDEKFFCSKYVYKVYEEIGIQVGKIETLGELRHANPDHSTWFWRVWFVGFVPWDQRTVTPGSQLEDDKFITVLESQ